MMIYGYARVSTASQSLKEQIEQLSNEGVSSENLFKEKYTGTTSDRVQFKKLLETVTEKDTIIVTKLDRFARNTREALEVIEPLLERDINIRVLNLGIIENTSMGRMILRTLLSVAEMERDMIIERTQEGKAYAKRNNPNYREGRPKAVITPQKQHAYELLKQGNSYKRVVELTGFSQSTLQRIRKKIENEK
ncbi:recombinase family protein [Vagococcus fluvialis]|uniref:Recombinase family protein n=1 Tax=Vagococcus fluvialis TaxID=2738 RepID=A0A7X6D7V6_9ENTE|nr:recombinase family protein [Vagococcus fluvialis]